MKKIAIIIWLLSVVFIIAGSLLPNLPPTEKYNLDKFIHGGAYAALAFLSCFFISSRKNGLLFLVIIIAIGGGIEILQNFLPGRSGTIGDFIADSLGVLLGALIALKFKPLIIRWFNK